MPDTSHLRFRKSSYSTGKGQDCVEVADTAGASAVRDSKHPDEGHLLFPAEEWKAFIGGLTDGEL